MASIDTPSGVSNEPNLGLNESDFIALKSVIEVATLEELRWKYIVYGGALDV
jgi:hypothetical protein